MSGARMTIGLTLAACAALAGPPARARPPSVEGLGGEPCAVFVRHAARADATYARSAQWVIGYMSGRIEAPGGEDHRPIRSAEAVMAEVTRYCRTHPGDTLDDAVNDAYGAAPGAQ